MLAIVDTVTQSMKLRSSFWSWSILFTTVWSFLSILRCFSSFSISSTIFSDFCVLIVDILARAETIFSRNFETLVIVFSLIDFTVSSASEFGSELWRLSELISERLTTDIVWSAPIVVASSGFGDGAACGGSKLMLRLAKIIEMKQKRSRGASSCLESGSYQVALVEQVVCLTL